MPLEVRRVVVRNSKIPAIPIVKNVVEVIVIIFAPVFLPFLMINTRFAITFTKPRTLIFSPVYIVPIKMKNPKKTSPTIVRNIDTSKEKIASRKRKPHSISAASHAAPIIERHASISRI
ncbi:MAG: hypothetical protein QXL15_03765 [Candidatus Korarchaeota archaeon]